MAYDTYTEQMMREELRDRRDFLIICTIGTIIELLLTIALWVVAFIQHTTFLLPLMITVVFVLVLKAVRTVYDKYKYVLNWMEHNKQ